MIVECKKKRKEFDYILVSCKYFFNVSPLPIPIIFLCFLLFYYDSITGRKSRVTGRTKPVAARSHTAPFSTRSPVTSTECLFLQIKVRAREGQGEVAERTNAQNLSFCQTSARTWNSCKKSQLQFSRPQPTRSEETPSKWTPRCRALPTHPW